MCGILVNTKSTELSEDISLLSLLNHRGPDAQDYVVVDNVFFGHTRLSILETSSVSNQPLTNDAITMVYNGEIYNYIELGQKYFSKKYSGDSLFLLDFLETYGTQKLNELDGMFAVVYMDRKTSKIYVFRDSLGIKPIYHVQKDDHYMFSSEIKPLLTGSNEYDRKVLNDYILFGYSTSEKTLFKGVEMLKPGMVYTLQNNQLVLVSRFSDFVQRVIDRGFMNIKGLYHSVKSQMVSDVRMGILLSGGRDSNFILFGLNKLGLSGKLDAAFVASGIESELAERSARKIKVDKEQINASQHFDIAEYVRIAEEPLCNPSGLLLRDLSRKARESNVKVLLSGLGGDELLGGYNRHKLGVLVSLTAPLSLKLMPLLRKMFPGLFAKFVFRKITPNEFILLSNIASPNIIFRSKVVNLDRSILKRYSVGEGRSIYKKLRLWDVSAYLEKQNLRVSDKFSMNSSVELRVPLWSQGLWHYYMRRLTPLNGVIGKSLFSLFLLINGGYFLLFKKKKGFGGDLSLILGQEDVKDLLLSEKTRNRGIHNVDIINEIFKSEINLSQADCMQLIGLAIIEQWFRIYIDNEDIIHT